MVNRDSRDDAAHTNESRGSQSTPYWRSIEKDRPMKHVVEYANPIRLFSTRRASVDQNRFHVNVGIADRAAIKSKSGESRSSQNRALDVDEKPLSRFGPSVNRFWKTESSASSIRSYDRMVRKRLWVECLFDYRRNLNENSFCWTLRVLLGLSRRV